MALNSLTLATEGLIGENINSIVIATEGLIQPALPVDIVRITYGGGGGEIPDVLLKRFRKRLEPKYDIHKDDQEVIELIIESILSGILDGD